MKKCPYCGEEVQDYAISCKYCGNYLSQKATTPDINPAKQAPIEKLPTDRAGLIQEIAEYEKKIATSERILEELGLAAKKAGTQCTWAYVGIILGLFFVFAWGLGLILVIAGVLAALTQNGKRREAEQGQSNARQDIETAKRKIADLRAALAQVENN